MRNKAWRALVLRWLLVAGLATILGTAVNASSCSGGGEFKRTLGSKLDVETAIERTTAEYKYVADRDKRLYWPNKRKYWDNIPKGSRAWILNDENLAKYKGFKPGPR